MLRCEIFSDAHTLPSQFLDGWKSLPIRSPMQSPAWLLQAWHAQTASSAESKRLCILAIFNDHELIGVAPWYIQIGALKGRQLRFLGDGLICSDHATFPCSEEHRPQVCQEIAAWLMQSSGVEWDLLLWESIPINDAAIDLVHKILVREGFQTRARPTTNTWEVQLPGDWDAYLAQRSKNHRKRCRRWQRTFFDSGRANVRNTPVEDCAQVLKQLADLNRGRRQQKGDLSAFENAAFSAFCEGVVLTLVAGDQAQLRELTLDGQTVAIEFVLHDQNTVYCYQSGMLQDDSGAGYGNLSIMSLLKDSIEQGFQTLDFLRGDEDYKTHWGASPMACQDLTVAARSTAATTRLLAHDALDALRLTKQAIFSGS